MRSLKLGNILTKEMPGIELDMGTVQTNMIQYAVTGLGLRTREYIAEFLKVGVKASENGLYIRMVTRYGITLDDIEYTIGAIHNVARSKKSRVNGALSI